MKRSQMIRCIQDALWCHLPHIQENGYYENSKYIAESVLQTIEGGNPLGEGMTPPYYTCTHPKFPQPTPFGSCRLYEWEPEDEK